LTERFTALRHWPVFTIVLIALTILISVMAPEPSSQFDFFVLDREQPRPWPWLTTHFLHTDPAHLLWNVLALGCLGWLGEAEGRVPFVISCVSGSSR
jgi:membrane associated rhomboid family serine protease